MAIVAQVGASQIEGTFTIYLKAKDHLCNARLFK